MSPASDITYAYDPEAHQTYKYDKYSGSAERTMQQIYYDDGRLQKKTASGPSLATHYSDHYYDANGNTTLINTYTDGPTLISGFSIGYTTADEIATFDETIVPVGGPGVARSSSFSYQKDGLIASRAYEGSTKTYSYKFNGLELNTFFGDTTGTQNEFYGNGALKKTTLPNGSYLEMTYDAADRVRSKVYKKSTGVVLSSFANIAYDNDDNRTYEDVAQLQVNPDDYQVQGVTHLGNGEYRYDNLDRLNYYKHPFEVGKSYTLDDSGNMTNDGEYGYLYSNNRLTDRTNPGGPYWISSHYYDHFGNQNRQQTPSGDTTTTYDAASHARRVTSPDGSWVEYGYDGLDRMIWRKDSTGATTIFFHDRTTGETLIETDGSGTTQTKYLLDTSGETVASEVTGVGRGYYVSDARGNLIQMTDPSQNVVSTYGYDAFGKQKDWLTKNAGSWDSRLRFQTAPRDPKTGAYSLGARLYDPSINRFIGVDNYVGAAANMQLQIDPLTGNRYLYAGCNPVGLIDDGHAPKQANCRPLGDKIRALRDELKKRWLQILLDRRRLPWSGLNSISGHRQQYNDKVKSLQKLMQDWRKDKCGGPGKGGSLPADVDAYVVSIAPLPQWLGGYQPLPRPLLPYASYNERQDEQFALTLLLILGGGFLGGSQLSAARLAPAF